MCALCMRTMLPCTPSGGGGAVGEGTVRGLLLLLQWQWLLLLLLWLLICG